MTQFLPRTRLTLCATLVLGGLLAGCDNNSSHTTTPVDRSAAPQKLQVPTLAFDDSSISLAWEKPTTASGEIKDYNVYMNGKLLGSTLENQDKHSPAKPYIDNFYSKFDADNWHVRVKFHNFTADSTDGLKPDTEYKFTVRTVYADGKESVDSETLTQRTSKTPHVIDVKVEGAADNGTTLATAVIQQAIDSCTIQAYPQGCKVLLSGGGVFKTGALFLHSDMTFEIAEGTKLLGSENPADYPVAKGYYLYPYRIQGEMLTKRPPSLLNVLEANDHGHTEAGTFKNIRIVGKGSIDGNGWVAGLSTSKPAATFTDEMGNALPQIRASSASKVKDDGILAKNQTQAAVDEGVALEDAYKNRRSSMMTLRGVSNLYVGGLTVLNPAYHGVMALESENVVMHGLQHKTYDGNNADGIEFGNSQNVMVYNNFFDTGDDSVNFAAGYGAGVAEFGQKAQSGAWIFNNYFREGHGAVVAGSHTGAWIEKIVAENNVMYLTDVGLRMKSRPYYGGGARDVLFRDNAMKDIGGNEPFIFTIAYSADTNDTLPAKEPAQFRDITVYNITIDGSNKKSSIAVDGMTQAAMDTAYGFDLGRDAYHKNFDFEDVKFRNVKATAIGFLHDSQFKNVTFDNVLSGAQAWSFGEGVSNVKLKDSVNDETITTTGSQTITRDAATQ
ncbi:glycoside hydrolase family 28 protein [Candidatus Symbiopectobacterium sp. NZEC127]|uniref:glycoside hydrolase family 28 protein n=1 Tax=Candidatus Symbiopectobacterium sp. NZEC127 TaxID=2820472 RepID=UPI00222700D3|nr:glycoside hydrolase family 28 protein [Candidatus Symbiopectobacterium sp. NZEC127]MCW2485999.1 glycoside hydrolase family 28 protein [Candidatus Symbiopectobacterium sp. NZEC127]